MEQSTTKTPTRTLRWYPSDSPEFDDIAGLLEITQGKKTAEYIVREFPTGWQGRGFTVSKIALVGPAEVYDVFVCARGAEGDSCSCAGGSYRGKCKHADALRFLVQTGRV